MSRARPRAILPPERVTIVGVLNATPDSFSDGGRFVSGEARVDAAAAAVLLAGGAHVLDVGGESTRPGARAVPAELECDRVVPVIEALAKRFDARIWVDTRRSAVARVALAAGACALNDVSGLRHDPALAALAAES